MPYHDFNTVSLVSHLSLQSTLYPSSLMYYAAKQVLERARTTTMATYASRRRLREACHTELITHPDGLLTCIRTPTPSNHTPHSSSRAYDTTSRVEASDRRVDDGSPRAARLQPHLGALYERPRVRGVQRDAGRVKDIAVATRGRFGGRGSSKSADRAQASR